MSVKKLLYVSCHPTLESCDYRMFIDLGFQVQSTGFYCNPKNPTSKHLASRNFSINKELYNEFKRLNPHYTYGYNIPLKMDDHFIRQFDLAVVVWRGDYMSTYLDLFQKNNIPIIFHTAGQSDVSREEQIKSWRNQGVKVVGVMPQESRYPNFGGRDKSVWAYVENFHKYLPWVGSERYIMLLNSFVKERAVAASLNTFLQLSQGLPKKLFGTKNENFKEPFVRGSISEEELYQEFSINRLFFSLGSKPSPMVYGFLEALASGCPVVTWGSKLGSFPRIPTYCMHEYIENGVSGFYSDSLEELRNYCEMLLHDQDLAKNIGQQGREVIRRQFNYEGVKARWRELLEEMGVI